MYSLFRGIERFLVGPILENFYRRVRDQGGIVVRHHPFAGHPFLDVVGVLEHPRQGVVDRGHALDLHLHRGRPHLPARHEERVGLTSPRVLRADLVQLFG
jgi:hypothetical protein